MAEAVRPERKRKKAKKIEKASPKTKRESPSTKWFVEDESPESFSEKATLGAEETKSEVQLTEELDRGNDANVAKSGHEDADTNKDENLDEAAISLENNLENENNDTNKGGQDICSENAETILEDNKEKGSASRGEILELQEKVDDDVVINEQVATNAEHVNLGEASLVHAKKEEANIEASGQITEHQDGETVDDHFKEIDSNVAETGSQDCTANPIDENQTAEKEETFVAVGEDFMPTTEVENKEEIEKVNADLQDIDFNVAATNIVNIDEDVNELNKLVATEGTVVAEAENSQVIPDSNITLAAEEESRQVTPDSLTIPAAEVESIVSGDSSSQELSHQQQENVLSIDSLPPSEESSTINQETLSYPMNQSAQMTQSMFMQPVQNIAVRAYEYTPSLISQTMPIIPAVGVRHEVLCPFTEEQLRIFYFNPELEQITVFIDQFLQNVNKETHEFYELLNTYCRSRLSFVKVTDEIKTTKQAILSKNDDIWTTKSCEAVGEGLCKDKQLVKKIIPYNQVEFHEDEAHQLKKLLKDLRSNVHEEFQLKSYNSQLAKIRIECYIHSLLDGSSFLRSIKTEDSVTAKLPRSLSQDDIRSLTMLQDAISILFSFKRMGEVEEEFCKDIDSWLEKLVSILQRAGALPDYFFILNHLLRCPPLSIAPMAHFIQFPDFNLFNSDEVFDSPLVHHFVVMLATVAFPVKERAKFLMRYKHMMKPATKRSMSWTLVDEDREEDENPEESWCLLMENDLVAIFEQFPFEKLFHYLLRMNEFQDEVSYSAATSSSNDVMRILAFTSCMVKLLGQLFDTYNMLRYRQFVKRISRTIRLVVQIVSDHWCAYRSWRIEVCGDSDKDIPKFLTVAGQYSLERLQLEFDQFFAKATEQILNSQSVGALQFLASMPYEAISTNAAWSLLNRLVQMPKDEEGTHTQRSRVSTAFEDINAPGEMVFLLTALSNMAISRSKDDRDFIECVVKSLLEISYTDSATKDVCAKRDCRDLLAAIASTHSFVMSPLLASIGNLAEKLGEGCVYILKALPFNIWIPETKDLEKLRSWLLENPLHSAQHQMAKAVLSNMNFDINQENGRLFLPQKFHFAIAVMLVEVYGSCFPDGQGGLKKLEYETGGIISQVGAFAYQSINKILNAQVQDKFLTWCWDVMLSLKLHTSDITNEDVDEEDQNMLLTFEESSAEENGSWFDIVLRAFEKFNPEHAEIEHCPELLNVHRALSTHGVLASYVALSMTKLGHSYEIFMEKGLKLLSKILEAGWIDAGLRILSDIFPFFFKCFHLHLMRKDFLQLIDCLVHMDASKAGYTEKIWQYPEPGLYSQKLASIITNHLLITTTARSEDSANDIMKIWFSLLTYGQNWYRDFSVQFLLDHMCKVVFFTQGKLDVIVELLYDKFETLIDQQSNRGIISSVMSWISTTASTISLLDIKKQPDYSYYAFAVLQVEKAYEDKIGIWKSMCSRMAAKPALLTEMAHKKALSKLKASYFPTLQNLNIYRWADQGLASNNDHPILPLIWQQFFMLYLQKQNTEAGLPSRVGVGYRFFDNVTYTALAKKMRTQLYSIASHHREKSLPKEDGDENSSSVFTDPKSHIHDQTMHATLASIYQAMALWLEEPRLHDPSLFLDALPEIYKQVDLEKIFQGDKELWLQYVDRNCIEREIDSMASLWTSPNKSSKTKSVSRTNTPEEMQQMKPTATQRLIKRLNRENKPKPPSAVQESNSPIPEVSMQLLLSRPRFIQELNNDLERVLLFAKRSVVNFDQHTALDEEYYELLCDLYENLCKQVAFKISCDVKKHPCTGPAKVIVRYEEMDKKDRHARILEENRNVWETNLSSFMQGLPHNLCTGAVYVESVISKLMQSLQYGNESQKVDLKNAGISLFYLVAELINADVKRNHPAIQFFSSCTEVLGKELIANNEAEQLRLVRAILSEEASVSFLAPHFNPAAQFRSFLQLYSATAEAYPETNETTLFVLLTKFDVRAWLSVNPSPSECVFMVRTIITAMQKFGKVPAKEVEMLFGIYRTHLFLLLSYRFPQQYSEILRLLAEASDKENLPLICWADFLSYIGCVNDEQYIGSNFERIQLQFNEANETIIWLADFFAEVSKSRYYSNSKMYTAWSQYIPYISKFFLYLFVKTTEPSVANGFSSNLEKERYISSAWNQIFAVYRPWIVPHKADRSWPASHVEQTILMVQSFVESAQSLAGFNIANNTFSIGMNMVWAFYCAEIAAGLKEENSLEIYHGLFTMSWISFCPSVQDLQRMLELQSENPHAFVFLGTILCGLDWPTIINQHARLGRGDGLNDFLLAVLRVYVMLSSSKPFVLKAKTQFKYFTDAAVNFPWQFMRPQDIDAICGWFAENSDPIAVLMEEFYSCTVLQLLKMTCVLVKPDNQSEGFQGANPENCLKQNSYIKMIVKLISRAADKKNFMHHKLDNIIPSLLTDIQKSARLRAGTNDELISLLSTFLTLLNSVSNLQVLNVIETLIHKFISETNEERTILCMLSAGCRVLASLEQLVTLSEKAIESFFTRQSDADFNEVWTKVLQVLLIPDLNQDEFVRKALTKQCLLTLYAYNLHRLSICSGPEYELPILNETLQWCFNTPPSPLCSEKTLLIWWQIMHCVKRQVFAFTQNSQHKQLSKNLQLFANYLQQTSEDKSYSGILGVIGFGKKSSFSPQFRLVARSLQVFILAQIPSGRTLRSFPDAPGDIKGDNKKESATQEAKNASHSLISLKKNKNYVSMKEEIKWMSEFILDPKTCLLNGPELLLYICDKLYCKVSFIIGTINSGNSTAS